MGLWVWYFVEFQNLTVHRGISEKGRKGRRKAKSAASWSLWVSSEIVGQKIGRKTHDDDAEMMVLGRGIFKKANSKMMMQTTG